MTYIEGHDNAGQCIFCDMLKSQDGPENLVLRRGRSAFVVLNRYPYTNGHMMIVPVAHHPTIELLDSACRAELINLASQAVSVLRQAYGAEAFNLGINIGEAAGAGIAEHVHMHVLPRWMGDTNFMATTALTRVIPESLEVTYQRLLEAWQAIDPPREPPHQA
jgi:ATP adenylyltransferase